MALMDFVKKQFIDIIHWTEETDGVLAYRFPMQDFEIQNGAQLTVRDTQQAMFVDEGRIADVFGPGRFKLTTQTLAALPFRSRCAKRISAWCCCAPSTFIPTASPAPSCSTSRSPARAKATPPK